MSKQSLCLIPLTVEARGEIIANNLPEFRERVREALSNINLDLRTDEDFGQAELDVKALKQAEDAVRTAALHAFDDELKRLVEGLDETADEIRVPRLDLEKLIAKRKEEVKTELIAAAMDGLACAPRLRHATYGKSLADAIKGKRTMESMQKALDVQVEIHNIAILKNREEIAKFAATHGQDLVMDAEDLEVKPVDYVNGELRRRIEAKRAQEEKKRLEKEAAEARAAEAKAKAEAKAQAELPPAQATTEESTAAPHTPAQTSSFSLAQEQAASVEWAKYTQAVIQCFGQVKPLRDALKHERNKALAAILADGINAAWKEMRAAEQKGEAA